MYLSDVGCKKAASANVESIFSGAGKFTSEAGSVGHVLLSRMVKLHYNWKYIFLRPTIKEVVDLYNKKFRPTVYAKLLAAAKATTTTSNCAGTSAEAASANPADQGK